LRPGGVFLNHGIARRVQEQAWIPLDFAHTYVFPDGALSPISYTLRAAEESGFEVRDVENLREHYVDTLAHWVTNLESRHTEALKYVDEPTYRVWRTYMSASIFAFRTGLQNLFQSLLYKPGGPESGGLPRTREDWYRK
jgi:cyclopropane-fatty-acyl-phospholipid synthase